jgi:hypothetical protein
MKRNLLIIGGLLLATASVVAQKKSAKPKYLGSSYSGKGLTITGSAFLFPPKKAEQPATEIDYKQPGAPLPGFTVINTESKDITEKAMGNGNLFVMMFVPTCEHCEDETRLLINNISLFKKSKVLMMATPVQTPYISYFDAVVHFSEHPSVFTVSVDSADILHKLFNYTELPQINIYNSQRQLLRTFNGDTPLDSLKQYID